MLNENVFGFKGFHIILFVFVETRSQRPAHEVTSATTW